MNKLFGMKKNIPPQSLEEAFAGLKRENSRLREQLGRLRRTALEKPFAESTSSGKMLVKPSSPVPEGGAIVSTAKPVSGRRPSARDSTT